jgi:hypothetical protein
MNKSILLSRGASPLEVNGLPVAEGVVRWFDLKAGSGIITSTDDNVNS